MIRAKAGTVLLAWVLVSGCGNATGPATGPPPAARGRVTSASPSSTRPSPTTATTTVSASSTPSSDSSSSTDPLTPDDLGLTEGVPWAMTYPSQTQAADIDLDEQGSSYRLEGLAAADVLAYYRANLARSFIIDSDLTANGTTTVLFHDARYRSVLTCTERDCRLEHRQR